MVYRAKEIMDPHPLTVDGEVDALEGARRMVAERKGYAIVTRGGPTAITGIVTEWDFLEKIVARGVEPSSMRMREIASTDLQSCSPDTPTDEVVSRMATLGIRRMIVRTGDQVVGVITSRHLLASFRRYIDRLSSEIASGQTEARPLG